MSTRLYGRRKLFRSGTAMGAVIRSHTLILTLRVQSVGSPNEVNITARFARSKCLPHKFLILKLLLLLFFFFYFFFFYIFFLQYNTV